MSKLAKAPLVEVIFELRWEVKTKEELTKCQYLHGDLFSQIKNEYKHRELLISPEVPLEIYVNTPSHRFRVAENEYPLVQVGPGLLTINTIDSKYVWEEYENQIVNVTTNFLEVYKLDTTQEVSLSLQYYDFIEFSFEKNDVLDFLNKNLNTNISQSFYQQTKSPNNFNLAFNYSTEMGLLSISFIKGLDANKREGIVIKTSITNKIKNIQINTIEAWLKNAHEFCSQLFKDMTKGLLYESFS